MINKTERTRTPLYIVFVLALFWAVVFGIIGGIGVMMRRDKR